MRSIIGQNVIVQYNPVNVRLSWPNMEQLSQAMYAPELPMDWAEALMGLNLTSMSPSAQSCFLSLSFIQSAST